VRAGDAERRKIEQNLHDGVQQRLIRIRIDLELARESSAADPERHDSELQEIGAGVDEALDELREVAHGLYPPVLTDWGIVRALERTRVPAGASLAIEAVGAGRHPAELESAVYHCCLEGIQNASKHAGPAVAITVSIRVDNDSLSFNVTDDGPGFDLSRATEGAGLHNMRDRIGALEGRLSIIAAPGRGTTVAGTVPLNSGAPRSTDRRETPTT
jgi:signal transduction histidine kinase